MAKAFHAAARLAVEDGLAAVALLDSKGKPIAIAGELDEATARALAAFAARHAQVPRLLARLQDGEMLDTTLDDRAVQVGIAGRCVFMVVVLPRDESWASLTAIADLRMRVDGIVAEATGRTNDSMPPAPSSPSGGSSSGPAELVVLEVGVSVPRGRN